MTLNNHCSLSVELLPEFGWSIKNIPIYGPGSVFQGSIKLNITSEEFITSRVRLVFCATESVPPYELSPGVIRAIKQNIFSIQYILWDSKKESLKLDTNIEHSFPFTIQMPMVQFPPSIQHLVYQCKFQLVALVDTPESLSKINQPIRTELPLIYMPFVETSMMKSPYMIEDQKAHLSAQVKMNSLSFVPNDHIQIKVHAESQKIKKKSTLQYLTVTLKLIQNIEITEFNDINNQIKTITSVSHKLPLVDYQNSVYSMDADIQLKVPADTTPSCDYSNLAKISYSLQISVEQKGPMGGIWNYSVNLDPIPITIGTLGYGIKSSSELQLYSSFQQSNMPLPKFMKAIEYEDALPLYDPTQLPTYDSTSSTILTI